MDLRSALRRITLIVAAYRFFFRIYYTLYTRLKPATIKVGQYNVNLGDDMGQKKSYLDSHYFEFYDRIVSDYIKPGDTVLDIGAHVGVTATMFSEAVGEGGAVFAFEPFPVNYRILQSNIRRNGIDNVHAIQCAASDKVGTLDFFINQCHTGYSSISYKNTFDYLKVSNDIQTIKVQSTTLDDFIARNNIRPAFIKIDCQGAEYQIIKGAREFFAAAESVFVCLEFWPKGIRNISNVSGEAFLEYLEDQKLEPVFAEDFNGLLRDKRRFATEIENLERGYTNLLLQKKAPEAV